VTRSFGLVDSVAATVTSLSNLRLKRLVGTDSLRGLNIIYSGCDHGHVTVTVMNINMCDNQPRVLRVCLKL